MSEGLGIWNYRFIFNYLSAGFEPTSTPLRWRSLAIKVSTIPQEHTCIACIVPAWRHMGMISPPAFACFSPDTTQFLWPDLSGRSGQSMFLPLSLRWLSWLCGFWLARCKCLGHGADLSEPERFCHLNQFFIDESQFCKEIFLLTNILRHK